MSIDPKYANLPGIDLHQPDVYETSELPESDQGQLETVDPDGDSVEQINVTANQAFAHFKASNVDAQEVDFSDRVGNKMRRKGYKVPIEYEILPSGSSKSETPAQKLQRLQHEVRELSDELTQIREQAKETIDSEGVSPVNLSKQVEYLKQQMADLQLDSLLGENAAATVNLADPMGVLQSRLLSEIASFKNTSKTPAKSADGKGDGDGHVTYQLYYRPEQAKFSNNARMADIEERIERIEALLGNNPEKLTALTADTANKSLVSAVAVLSAKTKLLDSAQLDQVEGRMLAINQRLNQLLEKKDSIEQTEKVNKVSELYGIVKKWDALSDTLPTVVNRLTALKSLHEQALQFSQSLTHLDASQQQINTNLKAHGDMMNQINSTFTDNMAMIKANFDTLDTRMKAIKK